MFTHNRHIIIASTVPSRYDDGLCAPADYFVQCFTLKMYTTNTILFDSFLLPLSLSSLFFSRSFRFLFYSIIPFRSYHQTTNAHNILYGIFVFHSFFSIVFGLFARVVELLRLYFGLSTRDPVARVSWNHVNQQLIFTTWLMKECCS